MFTEYPGFEEAVLYQFNKEEFSLEIQLNAPNITLDQSGKTTFLLTNTLMGALYYGNSISTLMSDGYSNDFPAISLLTAGAGFLVPYLAGYSGDIEIAA